MIDRWEEITVLEVIGQPVDQFYKQHGYEQGEKQPAPEQSGKVPAD